MPLPAHNYWWLNANPAFWSFDSFKPGDETPYWNANPDGSPRKVQENFGKVAVGDLVVGYSTTPEKIIKCICEIAKPDDGKKFIIRKLADLPSPVPQSEWSKLPAFTTFQYRGTLYQLDDGQWNSLVSLILKRNPNASLPFSVKVYSIRGLFTEMMSSPNNTWHDNFKESFTRFSKKGPLSEADLKALVFEKSNGIASAGQSIITNDFYKKLSSNNLFLNALRDFRNTLDASAFHRLADICDSLAKQNKQRKFRLKVNRIASALTTSVSAVPDEHAFGKVLQWLKARGLLGFEPGGNDSWFENNQQLVSMLDKELSDVDGYDVWYRNIFPWWIYEEKVQKGNTFILTPPKQSMKKIPQYHPLRTSRNRQDTQHRQLCPKHH